MEKKFTSDEKPLADLLAWAERGQLQLPDFQRGWVWSDRAIVSLLASISLTYPIGAVMTLRTGNPDVSFRPRPLEGVRLDGPVEPEFLLLDGQQRCTSLYLALKSRRPVLTRDDRGVELERRYYADMHAGMDPDADREEAIISVPADGVRRTFRGEVTLDVSTREREIDAGLFPLDIVLDTGEANAWGMAYMQQNGAVSQERFEAWQRFLDTVVTPFQRYELPTIELARSTAKEAVCQVFEKVNTGGVTLTVFELLTATYAADDFNLRDDWSRRSERLHAHKVLRSTDETSFLQVVTLLATYARQADVGQPVGCKRRDLLRLRLEEYQAWAEAATVALERLVPFLHSEHVFTGATFRTRPNSCPSQRSSRCSARTRKSRSAWAPGPLALVRGLRRDVRRIDGDALCLRPSRGGPLDPRRRRGAPDSARSAVPSRSASCRCGPATARRTRACTPCR